jgi:hypothetical protein
MKRTVTPGIRRPVRRPPASTLPSAAVREGRPKQMFGGARARVLSATGLGLALAVAVPGAASAAADHDLVFAAGSACTFDLGVDVNGVGNNQLRVTKDRNGLPRTVSAGTGLALTFTNDVTGKHLSFGSNGAVAITQATAAGDTILTLNGHNAVFMSTTDIPAGPSATLYIGQVVISIDASNVFTVLRSSGTAVDICAAVS